MGVVLLSGFVAVVAWGIQKARGIEYNGWKAGIWLGAVGGLAQLLSGNPMMIAGSLLGLLVVFKLANAE